MSDDILTIREAAIYCNVRPFAIRRVLRSGKIEFEIIQNPRLYGPRIIMGVRKSTLLRLREKGFLMSRPGRRPTCGTISALFGRGLQNGP